MEVATGHRPPPPKTNLDQAGTVIDSIGDNQQQDLDPRSSQAQEDIVKAQLRAAKMKRSRADNEPCVIPNKLLHRLDVSIGSNDILPKKWLRSYYSNVYRLAPKEVWW